MSHFHKKQRMTNACTTACKWDNFRKSQKTNFLRAILFLPYSFPGRFTMKAGGKIKALA